VTLIIRPGETSDLNRLVDIYNHYVVETHVTFDTEPFAVTDRIQWFNQFGATGPHRLLVAEAEAGIIGYASSTTFKPRAAYNRSVETTIYLDPGESGAGIGTMLYSQLLNELSNDEEAHRAYSGVALPNPGSIALHQKLGFEQIATYHEVGFKFDKYWDVSWYEKDLS
jgi:phosphinothricin acetyltransferase